MEQYELGSLNSKQRQDLVNKLYYTGEGYDFITHPNREITLIHCSKVEGRSTEPKHRCAVHAGEIRKFKDQFHLYLVNLRNLTLRQDQYEILKALEFVLGRELPNHKNILSMLHK